MKAECEACNGMGWRFKNYNADMERCKVCHLITTKGWAELARISYKRSDPPISIGELDNEIFLAWLTNPKHPLL